MVLSLSRVALALLQRTTMVQSLTRVALALLWLRSEAVPGGTCWEGGSWGGLRIER